MYEEPEVAPVHPTGPTPATETVDSAPGFEAPKNPLQFYKKRCENNILSLYFQRAGDGVSPAFPNDKIILSKTQV
ncbi:hypothetical protein [Streptococcus pneumoniae]|uniref:hypothetical protein n=1 Tax=Streptococcus pneumoniae TaxID=1313 RepID=UPI000B58AAE2|nr:hypothetical protein [Streptococcus pneumoniae]